MKPYSKSYLAPLLIFFSLGLLSSCLNNDDDTINEQEFVKVGDAVPEFHLIGDNGQTISSASMLGQVYLLSFFDTGCRDCQKEFPILQQIYDKYKGVLPVFNVPRSQTADEVKEYWSETGLSMPVYTPTDKSLYYKFATRGIPRIYIIDGTGKVLDVFTDSPIADFDTLDGILNPLLENSRPMDGINVSFKIITSNNLTDDLDDGLDVESNISLLDIFFFDSETKKLVSKVDIDSLGDKIKTNLNNLYWVESKKIQTGKYNIFAVANYKNIPQNIEEQKDLINLVDTETYKKGLGSSIPEGGPIMTSRADTLLNIDLTAKNGKDVTIVIEMERVIAKLRVSGSKDIFELKNGGTKYADVKISNYKLVNLMTQYYLFQHTDQLSTFIEKPDFQFPLNFMKYDEKIENQYVVDPLFYEKKKNLDDVNKFNEYYKSWYGNVEYNILEWAPFNQSDNIYLLENTSFKDSQINGYSTGIIFYASLTPVSVWQYDDKTDNLVEDFGGSWGDVIYLYNCKFYRSIKALNIASGLSLDESKAYSDDELKVNGIKQSKKVQGSYVTFYIYWIQHLKYDGDTDPMGTMRYGIVRNNLYNIIIDGVSGVGNSEIRPALMRANHPHSYLDVKVD